MRERLGEPATTVLEPLEEHRKYEILGRAFLTLTYHCMILMALRRLCTASSCGLRASGAQGGNKDATTIKALEENAENEG